MENIDRFAQFDSVFGAVQGTRERERMELWVEFDLDTGQLKAVGFKDPSRKPPGPFSERLKAIK